METERMLEDSLDRIVRGGNMGEVSIVWAN